MNIKKMGVLLLFFCLITLSISTVSADVLTPDGKEFKHIQDVVNDAKSGDIINLDNNIYTSSGGESTIVLKNINSSAKNNTIQTQSVGSPINVTGNKNITIQGQSNNNRATLNANNLHSILYINSGSTVTLRYINFEKGGFSQGAIIVYGNIIVENCTFSDSRGDQGSSILIHSSSSSDVIISYCNFINNHANNEGGAIFHNGMGILNISNSYFYGNSGKNGGVIYTTKHTIINSSNFTNNVATSNGGVIYTTVYLNITGGVMNGNNAVYGGAIYNTGLLILNDVTLTNNNAQILSVALEAPNSVQEGTPLIVTSYLISGNNAANAIYSKSDFVYIDGDEVKLSDKPVNKTITLNIDNVIHTRVTDSNGLAIFNFNIVIIGDLKISRLEVGFTEAGLSVSRVKNLAIMGREDISPLPESKGKTNKINSASKSKPSTKNALTKSNAKNLSKAKANAFIKSKKSSSSTKSKTIMQAYDYRNKKMVWFNVKNSATIKSYPAGLRNVITTTTTKVRYIVTTNTKNSNRYNSKTNTNTSVKYSVLYDIKGSKSKVVKVTTIILKQSTKKLANEYLQQSTNAEVNNPKIAALAKQITKGVKSDDYYTKAKLIYKWVQENIDYTLNADISAVDILSKKGSNGNYKAFCVGFSNVMAALCRSEGIPVQYHAIFFFEKEAYPFEGHSGHVYSKVYVNGKWLFADAATVGFTAPLNYKGYLQEMKTQPGGSYYTATNNWDYWNFVCNHHLVSHSDSHITKEAEGVPVLEYFNLSIKTTVNTVTAAYNVLNPYATANGYLISKNYYFSAFTNRVDSNNYISVWAFHYFDNSDNFLGYMLISQNGILFPVLETSTWVDPGDNGWEV